MIYLGADHRGFLLKEKIIKSLKDQNLDFIDLGAKEYIKEDDFPLISIKLAGEVVKNYGSLGILACGSGAGAAIAANKVCGIRAAICFSPDQTRAARHDDNLNLLCLSANAVSDDDNLVIVDIFLSTQFGSEERYIRRLKQISDYESQKC
ncbi:MAG: RpiB/LacA/LacB family sugar-phosphate isomerase [Patescibacteria group bacterium]